jgi:endonuclease/exonuclease/phosphatase family metal-dependent hydrolase
VSAPDSLQVLTWNLGGRSRPWPERQAVIVAILGEIGADIIGLQEVRSAPDRQLGAELAGNLGMYCAASSPHDGITGNAVLSRWPIGASESMVLTPAQAPEGRTVLYAEVDAPLGPVPFFTTQLSSAPEDSALRCAQVRRVAGFVAARAEQTFPPIVTGDLNAEPDADEVRLLCGHKTAPVVPGQVLVDAWRYAEEQAPEVTWDRANPYVLATHEPSARIDYVLVGRPGPCGEGHVKRTRRVADEAIDGIWPSDHAGVLVELAG